MYRLTNGETDGQTDGHRYRFTDRAAAVPTKQRVLVRMFALVVYLNTISNCSATVIGCEYTYDTRLSANKVNIVTSNCSFKIRVICTLNMEVISTDRLNVRIA